MSETLAHRARTWLKTEKPLMPAISKAHAGMLAKMQREASIDRDDADAALDVLVEAYVHLGGEADDLLNASIPNTETVATAGVPTNAQLDCGMLVEYDDVHHTPLPTAQKLAVFAALKQSIGISVQGAC